MKNSKTKNPILELKKEILLTRLDIFIGKEKNTQKQKNLKKKIARELTVKQNPWAANN